MSRGIRKTRAMKEDLPDCFGHHDEMDTICSECIIEMSCEVWRRSTGGKP